MRDAILLAHTAATLAMVGLVWFVQVVHYPLLARVPEAARAGYAVGHRRLTGPVVGPPMLVEAAAALALLVVRPDGVTLGAAVIGAVLLVVVWALTALVLVPAHDALCAMGDDAAVRALVRGNAARTAAWTGRGAVALWMVDRAVG